MIDLFLGKADIVKLLKAATKGNIKGQPEIIFQPAENGRLAGRKCMGKRCAALF